MPSQDEDPADSDGYNDWPHDLAKLQEIGKIALKKWKEENPHSPRDYPSVRWLRSNGYSHLRWILREKHDMGTPEFFVLFSSAGGSEGYAWRINDVATISLAKTYLNDRVECRKWSDATKRTNRAQLNEILHRFSIEYGNDNVVTIANDPSLKPKAYRSFKEVIKTLRDDLTSDDSTHHYVRAGHRFFEWLDREGRIVYDPMENIEEEFNWTFESDSSPFSEGQVPRIWTAAETDEERMLVIGYCVWGVRTKELPRVHMKKINLDPDDPHIDFEEVDRKNGSGKVSLLFGLNTLANLVETRQQDPDWNGYLFPGDQDRAFMCADQMRIRMKKLCRKAGVTVDGDVGTPKHGRAFYYNLLGEAETELLDMASKLAEEQESKDAEAVRDSYLTDKQRRQYRNIIFRDRLRDILPDVVDTEYKTHAHDRGSLDSFS